MNKKTVDKLKLAFWNDYDVSDACSYADISEEDYEKAIESNKSLARNMRVAQMYQRVKAKLEMAQKIRDGDARLAMKYLEVREPERYNLAYIRKFGKTSDD